MNYLNEEENNLLNTRRSVILGSGPYDKCKIAFVGEQPTKEEVRRFPNKPFSGLVGEELTSCTHLAGITRGECYLTYLFKDLDHPLEYYYNYKTNNYSKEGLLYVEILKKELAHCSANVIVVIGNSTLQALCDRNGVQVWRGSVIESTLLPSRKVIPIIDPSTILFPKNVFLNKHLIVMDLKKVFQQSEFPEIKLTERKVIIKPSYIESIEYLAQCTEKGLKGDKIDYDIELYNNELGCISFAFLPDLSMCIPFICSDGDYFSPDQEINILSIISNLLSNSKIRKGGQNIIFDAQFLFRKFGILTNNMDDTMVAQKTLFHEYSVGLDFITAMYTDIPYYKKEGKIWLTGSGSWENGWVYNGYDSMVCNDAFRKQKEDLIRQDNFHTYERQVKLISPLNFMMERGIKVNMDLMSKLAKEEEDKINNLQKELNQKVGRELNSNSPLQVKQYFYIEKSLPAYKEKGQVSVNEDALIRIFRKGFDEARIILDIRRAGKRRSTYLNPEKIDKDGRIRFSANPVGTAYSRISTSKTIFGTGMNMQNWPSDLRQILEFDTGYIGYEFDLSQFENRIVAYVGNVIPMINAFENDEDVHRLTAALIFNKRPEDISDEAGSSPMSGGRFSERFWGKKANHGLNYDLGYKSFAIVNEISESDSKRIVNAYHSAYPEVRNNYHSYVRQQLSIDRTITNLLGRKTLFLNQWGDELFKAAYSCIPQGTCGDIINERGVNFIYYNQQWFKHVEVLLQVHDSIVFQIPLTVPWIEQARILTMIKTSLETPLIWKHREFVVPVDLSIGLNMYKKHGKEIKHKYFPTNVYTLANQIESIYKELQEN